MFSFWNLAVVLILAILSRTNATTAPTVAPTAKPATYSNISAIYTSGFSTDATDPTTQLSIYVKLATGASEAIVYCGAFATTIANINVVPFTTTTAITKQGFSQSTTAGVATLLITGLIPSSTYNVYCMTVNLQDPTVRMPYVVAIKKSTLSTTQCCKVATFTTGISSLFFQSSTVSNTQALTISLNAAPTYNLTLKLTLYDAQTKSVAPASVGTLTPSTLTFYPSYTPNTVMPVVLVAGNVGTYRVNFTMSGASVDEFALATSGSKTIKVLSLDTEPSAPVMTTATFSSDGTYVTLLFDSPTNQGNKANTFSCNDLLLFDGVTSATCTWSDTKTILIYPTYAPGAAVLSPGSNIALYSNEVQAYCTDKTTLCTNWVNYAPSTTVKVKAPTLPTAPTVVMSGPATVGMCSPVTIDLSNSVGDAGRPWASTRVTVSDPQSNANITHIQALLNSTAYTISPPTPIPNKWLIAGHTYTFTATFVNFLGAVGSNSKAVTVSSDSLTPVVSIAGLTTRYITTWTQLLVTAVAYTQTCNGGQSANNLKYVWTIYQTGVTDTLVTTLTSASQNPAAFKLAAYALTVGNTYRVQVSVTSTLLTNPTPVTASVYVVVNPSSLVAAISGGSSRSVQVGDSYTIDASSSYDQDKQSLTGINAGLTYSWTCWQTSPSYSATCPVTLTQGSTAAQRVVTTTGGTVGAVARVTVTITSSGRTASSYMDIKLTNKPATVITIGSSLSSLTSVNVNQQITLTGSLAIVAGCVATWKVDDASLNLPAIALTPTNTSFTLLTPVVNTMALQIPGGSLPQRATLGFSLTCGTVSSTFSFTTNGSPLPGIFSIKPRSGIQLVDSFTFSGSQWIDPDLPLSYQFGFISPSSGALLVFQGKSESSYAITKLPGGSASAKHLIFGTLQVYDVYGAATTSQLNVTVTAGTNVTQQNAGLASLIAGNSGSVDDTNSVIATVGTVLNAVNCTGAPDCAALHRASCGSVSHTCGICLTGYLGVAGNQNSKCMTLAQYSNEGNRRRLTVGDSCTTNAGCNAGNWETCQSGKCVQASKSCPNSCSDLGTCTFTSSSTGTTVTSCGISDATCVASCVCNSGYGGTACEYTRAELDTRIAFRSKLIQSLENVTMIDDVNEVSIVNWATALSSLSLNSEELSVEDAAVVHRIANLTIAYALQMGTTDYASLIGLLESLDSATTVVATDARRRRLEGRSLSSSAAAHTNILQTAGSFGDVISKGMALDQTSTTYLYSNFRMSTQINTANAGNNVGIMGPQSDLEYYSGAVAPYINIEPTNDASGSLSSTMVIADTTSFAALASEMKSNPMQFRVNTAGDLKTVTFTMINNVNHPEYSSSFKQENFTHYCLPKVYNVSHTCSGSGTKVKIFCTGWAGTRTTWCPRPSPACSFLDGESLSIGTAEGCTVIDKPLQPGYTTCQCKLTSGHRRQLTTFANVLSETGVTNMVTTSTYIASTFADTFKASTDFTSPADARKVLIVILLFAILWAVGLLSLVGLCFDRKKKVAQSFEKRRSHKVGSSTHTTADVKRYLLAYVDKLIPDVYHATKSKMERAADETRKHHRYLQLFTARDDQISVNKRILTLCKMLTIQTMLMFLLAVLYDLQGPDDDGTCPDNSTKSTCLHRKSILDSSQTYCQWKIDEQVGFDTCTYKQPVFSAKIMMYIILLTSIFTAIFNTPIDKLFDTLEAPTGDSIGESRLVKATKAVAAGARRASVAAAGAAAAAATATKNTMSRMSVFKTLGLAHDEDKVLANRRIPEDVHFAHTLAYMSLPEISAQAQVTHLRQSVVNNEIRNVASKRMTQIRGSEMNKSMKKPVDESVRGAERTDGKDVDGKEKLKVTSDDMVDQLLEEIMQQRLILPSNSDETNEFDRQWGIEKNSVTSADGKTISTSLFINGYSLRGMSKDVATSEAKSRDLKEKMENFSDNQAGLDILHFFMVDLLGRHTLAAKIFENKFEEDFERTEVVSKYTKWFVVACIVGLNGFFMYYSLLKGYTKGIAWQNQYLQGCITQLFIEIFLFESMECVWINYWVPDLVSGEVMRAGVILRDSAEKISLADKHADSDVVHSKYFLDAPTYLFVSTKLAKKFPNLLESIIVNGYRNHLPGEIARTWRNEHAANENAEIVRNSYQGRGTFGAIMFSCIIAISSGLAVAMQALGSLPYFYQRIIIRFVQPVLLSGLTILWYFAVQNPIYVAAIVGSMILVAFVLYVRYKNRENNQAPAKIAPIVSPAIRHGLVSSHKDNGESKLADKSESKNAESKMNEVQMSGRNLHEAPLNKAQYAGSSLTSEGEGVRIVPKHHRKVAKNNDDSSDSAKDSN